MKLHNCIVEYSQPIHFTRSMSTHSRHSLCCNARGKGNKVGKELSTIRSNHKNNVLFSLPEKDKCSSPFQVKKKILTVCIISSQ